MNLAEYIKAERGNAKALSVALDVSMSYLSQMAAGSVPTNAERCVQIERATNGAVTRRDLRPDDWHRIWPELVTRKHPAPVEKDAA